YFYFFFSSRRRHTRSKRDWSSDVCSSDLLLPQPGDELGGTGQCVLLVDEHAIHVGEPVRDRFGHFISSALGDGHDAHLQPMAERYASGGSRRRTAGEQQVSPGPGGAAWAKPHARYWESGARGNRGTGGCGAVARRRSALARR